MAKALADVTIIQPASPLVSNVLATAILVISLILLGVGTLYRRKRIDV